MPTPETVTPDLGWLVRPLRLLTVKNPDEAATLRHPSAPVPAAWFENHSSELITFAHRLLDKTVQSNGVGFAAPQLDVPLRIIALVGSRPGDSPMVLYNPRELRRWPGTQSGPERCFSVPGEERRCTRWERIRVTADRVYYPSSTERAGTWESGRIWTWRGWDAVVYQHEFDHLEGRLITDHGTFVRR